VHTSAAEASARRKRKRKRKRKQIISSNAIGLPLAMS